MSRTILVFGSSGGIGSAIVQSFPEDRVVELPRSVLDLSSEDPATIVAQNDPDIVINAAGYFGDNTSEFDLMFNVNVRSNWNIIRFYKNNPPTKVVKFIMIGSSAYRSGRRDYILYAASKAALHNMFEGAAESTADTNLILGLVHPSKVNTPMLDGVVVNRKECLDPNQVAQSIKSFVENMQKSCYIELNNQTILNEK